MGWFDGMFGGQAPPPSDPYGGLMQGYAAPGMIQQQLQPLLNAQLGQPMAQLSLDQQLANQGYGNTMAGLGIRQVGLNRELGFFPQQQVIAYQRVARKYRPDQVLLGVCLNDIPELTSNLNPPPAQLS